MRVIYPVTDTDLAADRDALAFDLDYQIGPLSDRLAVVTEARADLHRQAARIDDRLTAIEHEITALDGSLTAYRTAGMLLDSGERPGFVRRELSQMLQHRPLE